ncbi:MULTISPECIES: hypothetical protein [Halorussus]|nr:MULTISPECIES: hypothetical protein [Halorussus]
MTTDGPFERPRGGGRVAFTDEDRRVTVLSGSQLLIRTAEN